MISDNVEEAVSGVKGENSVKVFGPDLDAEREERARDRRRHGDVAGREGPRHVRARWGSRA